MKIYKNKVIYRVTSTNEITKYFRWICNILEIPCIFVDYFAEGIYRKCTRDKTVTRTSRILERILRNTNTRGKVTSRWQNVPPRMS